MRARLSRLAPRRSAAVLGSRESPRQRRARSAAVPCWARRPRTGRAPDRSFSKKSSSAESSSMNAAISAASIRSTSSPSSCRIPSKSVLNDDGSAPVSRAARRATVRSPSAMYSASSLPVLQCGTTHRRATSC
eukprot:1917269-Prymnesium_polylepis.1